MKNRESDIGKIYQTTDGFFNNKPKIKKPRQVVVVHQRKDDGALGVAKIYSKKKKEGNAYITDLVLYPKDHFSLKEESIVGSSIIFGRKTEDKSSYKAIYKRELNDSGDKVTKKELKKIKAGIQSDNPKHRKTYKNTLKKWKNHFK